MESCGRTGLLMFRHAERPIANRPQDSILPHIHLEHVLQRKLHDARIA